MATDEELLNMFTAGLQSNVSETSRPVKTESTGYKYRMANMTYPTPTMYTGKFITDLNNKPFRIIKDINEVRYPDFDTSVDISQQNLSELYKRTVVIAPIEEFKVELTPTQIALYKEILDLVTKYYECHGDLGSVKYRSTVVLFYLAITASKVGNDTEITKYIPDSITVMKHTSANFVSAFNNAVNNKTQESELTGESKTWIVDYIKRVEGSYTKFLRFVTTNKRDTGEGFGYNTEVAFFEAKNNAVNITQEMLDAHQDLSLEYFNNKSFDEEYYVKVRDQLKALVDTNGVKITDA